ncbi:cytochrome P450 [Nocardia sp. XZ_19_369]|uniref:cytochrome P450 n=1 Tax=Nocardia sp. XZ_19_369 TaxID=2769487 RepID=UPI00188FE59D|nr:cytochrome P450 [Nocardia sp. XZ_19_369]
MLQPAFHRSRLPAYAASISAQIDAVTSAWQSGQDLDILMETGKFAANATATVVFSGAVPESTAAQNALIPFGGGARKCIGDLPALDEAAIALATIAARWRLRALPGNDMRPALAVTLHPRRLHMRAEIRTPATSPTSADIS